MALFEGIKLKRAVLSGTALFITLGLSGCSVDSLRPDLNNGDRLLLSMPVDVDPDADPDAEDNENEVAIDPNTGLLVTDGSDVSVNDLDLKLERSYINYWDYYNNYLTPFVINPVSDKIHALSNNGNKIYFKVTYSGLKQMSDGEDKVAKSVHSDLKLIGNAVSSSSVLLGNEKLQNFMLELSTPDELEQGARQVAQFAERNRSAASPDDGWIDAVGTIADGNPYELFAMWGYYARNIKRNDSVTFGSYMNYCTPNLTGDNQFNSWTMAVDRSSPTFITGLAPNISMKFPRASGIESRWTANPWKKELNTGSIYSPCVLKQSLDVLTSYRPQMDNSPDISRDLITDKAIVRFYANKYEVCIIALACAYDTTLRAELGSSFDSIKTTITTAHTPADVVGTLAKIREKKGATYTPLMLETGTSLAK